MKERKFVCIGKRNVFWRISKDQTKIIVRYGKIGTNGHVFVQDFYDEREVECKINRLAKSILHQGYTEIQIKKQKWS